MKPEEMSGRIRDLEADNMNLEKRASDLAHRMLEMGSEVVAEREKRAKAVAALRRLWVEVCAGTPVGDLAESVGAALADR